MPNSYKLLIITCTLIAAKCIAANLVIEGVGDDGQHNVQYGENLVLVCVYKALSIDGSVFEWFIPSSPTQHVASGPKAYVYWQDELNKKGYVLIVRSMDTNDAGRYTCRVGSQNGDRFFEMARAEVDVKVERRITAIDCPAEQWIPIASSMRDEGIQISGQPAVIRCIVQAFPAPTIHWQFHGSPIATGQRYMITATGLTIFSPSSRDAGLYTVIARQTKHITVFDIQVFIFSRPRITFGPIIVGPYNNSVVEKHEAYLQCLADGHPSPTIHWYRDRDPEADLHELNPQRFFVNANARVGKLRISRVIYPEDSGTYICRAVVSVPVLYEQAREDLMDEAGLVINVTVRPRLLPVTTMHRYIDVGETVTIQCRVRATEPLTLYFRRLYSNRTYVDGRQPDDPRITVRRERDSTDHLNHNLFLTIENTTLSDTWNYTCHAKNAGSGRRWNATIRVMQVPQMVPLTDDWSSTNEFRLLHFGWRLNATNLTCASEGMPHPTWTWYRRGEQILNGPNATFAIISFDYWQHSQSWLQIRPCRYTEHFIYDDYVCKATNIKGTNESTLRFARASVPGQPVLKDYLVTQSTLTVFIEPSAQTGGMPALGYTLFYSASGGPSRHYGPVGFPMDAPTGGPPRLTLSGLVASTGYQLELSVRNIVGRGTPLFFSVRTLDGTRPGPVEVLPAQYPTSYPYSHIINWKPPDTGGYIILGYVVRVRPVTATRSVSGTENLIIEASEDWRNYSVLFNNPYLNYFHFTSLRADQTYQFTVDAVNRIGSSLAGIPLERYGYLDSTPSRSPVVVYDTKVDQRRPYSVNQSVSQAETVSSSRPKNLVPLWYLFRTAPKDMLGPPPRIFGIASVIGQNHWRTFLIAICIHVLNFP